MTIKKQATESDENASVSQHRPTTKGAAARTVTVACKVPTGMALQLQRPVQRMEDTRDGPKPRTYNAKTGKIFYVHGPAYPVGTIPKGFPRPPLNEGGYALTPSIPADFWDEWFEQNRLADYVQPQDGAEHGMIFAYPDMEDTVAAAREQEKLLSGMEPISTDVDKDGRLTDPRLPRPMNMSVAKVGFEPHPGAGSN